MSSRYDGVLFDIGGVLEHNPPTNWQAGWCRRLGIEPAELSDRLLPHLLPGATGGITLEQVHEAVAEVLGLDAHDVAAFMEDLWAEYLGTPNTELIDHFASLRGRFATGILSNSFVGARQRERERYGFEDLCDVVVYSHEEGMAKPDPELYRLACRRLGVEPARTVFVDDTDEMLVGAAVVGMAPVKFIGQRETIAHLEGVLAGRADPWRPDGVTR